MAAEGVRLDTAIREAAGIPVVEVGGEVDIYTAPEFESAINQAVDAGAKHLIIDLTNVSHMDSSGFGNLLSVAKRLRPKGGSVNLVGCRDGIERMLRITRLDTIFGMHPTVDEAVEALGKE